MLEIYRSSGLITSLYFRKYFDDPGLPIEIGTIMAVLEVGTFWYVRQCKEDSPARLTGIITVLPLLLAPGRVGDMIGWKGTLFVGAAVFTLTIGFWTMILGRVLSGFGVGVLS